MRRYAVLALLALFASCSKSDDNGGSSSDKKENPGVVGSWRYTHDRYMVLQYNADGTVHHVANGKPDGGGTYRLDGAELIHTEWRPREAGKPVTKRTHKYAIRDDVLTLTHQPTMGDPIGGVLTLYRVGSKREKKLLE